MERNSKIPPEEAEDWQTQKEPDYGSKGGHKERSIANSEAHDRHFKRLKASLAIVALSLSACVPVGTEAYTTPLGITYLNGSENNPAIVAHENQHWEDYQADPLFFWKYSFEKGYACEAELRAGADLTHPSCKGYEKDQIKPKTP